jgi:hypothetical protein
LKLTVFESTYGLRGISTSNPKAKVLPAPIKGEKLQTEPEEVLIKSWKEGAPGDQLQPKWKGPRLSKYRKYTVGVIFLL